MQITSHFTFLKNICLSVGLLFLIGGCSSNPSVSSIQKINLANPPVILPEEQSNFSSTATTRVALLLPLTGTSANIGETLRNASTMAQFDAPNAQTELSFLKCKNSLDAIKQNIEIVGGINDT